MALELAAAIAGLISLVDLIVVKGSKFYSLTKNAQPEIQGLLQEGINLGSALYSLEKSVRLFQAMGVGGATDQNNLIIYIEDCKKCVFELVAVLDKCGPKDLSRWEEMKSSLKWSITAAQTRELTHKIQRVKSTVMMSLEAKSLEALYKLLGSQKSVQESLERIESKQEIEERNKVKKKLDAQQAEALDWLSTYKTRKHVEMKRVRHPGTSEWFRDCEEYREWLKRPNSLLWFDGIPGAGKSVLTSAVIEELQLLENEKTVVAYFYIEYSSDESQKFHTVVGTLLRQIIERNLESFSILDDYRTKYKDEFRNLTFDQALELTTGLSDFFATTILVVDGLDESEGNDRGEILKFLSTLGGSPHGSIKVIATSRRHYDIQKMLAQFLNISIAARSTDVQLFVAAELEKRLKSEVEFYAIRLQDPTLKAEIISTLVDRAEGMFQWVRCQLDTLSRTTGDQKKRAALQDLPRDLPETYRRILRRVDDSSKRLVRFILFWVSANSEATIEELTDIASHLLKDNMTARDILSNCSSLIKVNADEEIRISHFSVTEFLRTAEAKGEWYSISEEAKFPENSRALIAIDYIAACRWDGTPCGVSKNPHIFQELLSSEWGLIRHNYFGSEDRRGSHDKAGTLMPRLKSLFVSQDTQEWRVFSYNMLSILKSSVSSSIEGLDTISLHDIDISRLHVACFLGVDSLIKRLLRERQCNLESKLFGAIQPLHAWCFGFLLSRKNVDIKCTSYCVEEMIQRTETIDFNMLILLYKISDGNDQVGMFITDRFKEWVLAHPDAHEQVSTGLEYWLNAGFIIGQHRGIARKTFWDILWTSGFESHHHRRWLEILIGSRYMLNLVKKLDKKFEKGNLTAYTLCSLLWKKKDHSQLRFLLRLGIGELLDASDGVQLLEAILKGDESSSEGYIQMLFHLVRSLRERAIINTERSKSLFTRVFEILKTQHPEDGSEEGTDDDEIYEEENSDDGFEDIDDESEGSGDEEAEQEEEGDSEDEEDYQDAYRRRLENEADDKYEKKWLPTQFLPQYADIDQLLGELKLAYPDSPSGIAIAKWEYFARRSLQITDTRPSRCYVRYIYEECLRIALGVHQSNSTVLVDDKTFVSTTITTVEIPTKGGDAVTHDFEAFVLANEALFQASDAAPLLTSRFPIHDVLCSQVNRDPGVAIEKLVAQGHRIDEQDLNGETPLHLSIKLSDVSITRAIINCGADVNARVPNHGIDKTALGLAIQSKKTSHLGLLLRNDADRFQVDDNGRTYLHLLVESGSAEMLDIFLKTPTWYADALKEAATTSSVVLQREAPTEGCSNCLGSNIKFCLDVVTKGLAAMQLTNSVPSKGIEPRIANILDQIIDLSPVEYTPKPFF
ncbi:hypothetical protein ABW19_dt0202017 [Dactylella cylindrospora]|nr:hypothetical protein ABW19_dt0202017 [Dactylella cylindrospora]